ncbi:MAG: VanZ family protein [Betaproteobacteria bacterium]|nr:VanZ family protein [Betaproteobacteria bacterium]
MRTLWLTLGTLLIGSIWVLSLIPHPPHFGVTNEDKVGHLIAYGFTMWWWGQLWLSWRHRLLLALSLAAMGVAIEFVQGWTGWRTFDTKDMLANSVGVLLGWALLYTSAGRFYRYFDPAYQKRS